MEGNKKPITQAEVKKIMDEVIAQIIQENREEIIRRVAQRVEEVRAE